MIHGRPGGFHRPGPALEGRPVCLNLCDAYAVGDMDLSRIPEPLRSRLAEQLDALPPEVRGRLEQQLGKLPLNQLEGVLKKTAPMLERLAAKGNVKVKTGVAGSPKPPRRTGTGEASHTGDTTGQAPTRLGVFDSHNHYNNTVQRGDRESPPLLVIMFLVACALVFLRTLGFFSG